MFKYKTLDVNGAVLNEEQLSSYLQKLAADQILKSSSDRITYPIPRVKENLAFIYDVYTFLSDDLKNKIPIHPAGEWILDNFYVIEKNAKIIVKNLSLKKYKSLIGISNGIYKGYARIYILANKIISYTDGKIDGNLLELLLNSYQSKKTLSMDELWNINIFLQIALIEKIRTICEKIYLSQLQKRKVENIIDRLVEFKEDSLLKIPKKYNFNLEQNIESKFPFIEYMSYRLKKYGKRAFSYIEILEEQVNKMGSSINNCINREHYDIATKKVSIGNSITSINTLNRLNFVEIFNKTNGVEEILNSDPSGVYELMDYKTKEYYRAQIEKLAKKTKISEIYIAKKCLELAKKNVSMQADNSVNKKMHVGYYLISDGKKELYEALTNKKVFRASYMEKAKIYINVVSIISIIIGCFVCYRINKRAESFGVSLVIFILLLIPLKLTISKVFQYITGKITKPKLIPKLNYLNGIPEKSTTMVVIPAIVKDKESVKKYMKRLEVFYVANRSENLYFTLLGDCCSSKNQTEPFDEEIIKAGIDECARLNKKYTDKKFPKFNFIYRKRSWSSGENCYLGWERKRGLLSQFNKYILGNMNERRANNEFLENTFESLLNEKKLPNIKYVITLDADTNLVLNSGLELVGAMSHILNIPEIDEANRVVSKGYAIMQPRVGINLEDTQKSGFTRIFSGLGGTDSYTNAISDFYFDNFDEGIFTGKGIYDLQVFSEVMKNEIPENTVLSHDLLEGSYCRCGLASDIMLMDGYPTSYSAYRKRMHRWIRGDWQIFSWLFKKKLNILSKYKILDNLYRSLNDFVVLIILCLSFFVKSKLVAAISLVSVAMCYFLEIFNKILSKRSGELSQKKFSNEINGYSLIIIKMIIDIALIPDKAIFSIKAIIKSIYRMTKSKKHLLEWTTAEEAEISSKSGFMQYVKSMFFNVIFGVLFATIGLIYREILAIFLGLIWLCAPFIIAYISKPIKPRIIYDELNTEEKDYVRDIGKRTWMFFKDHLNERSNFLPPDNYQENRRNTVVYRTSPTNIGLALLSVIASYDLKYEELDATIYLLSNMIGSIERLPKWNGHLYNWYNIESCTPLVPKYVSSVDSGNFVGYLYVLKQFLIHEKSHSEKIQSLINTVDKIIDETDFSKLFDEKTGLFSIGFNIDENKLTDSYYDLLASEARQTSLVAIAKKDVSAKHWKNLSRTLTVLNKYKGLISWSGTAFEYLMPAINIKRYPNSLLDESCKFMIMSQIEYANKLGITWGISEAAFNLKDLNGNYQYKAFGIPWLGLKRGLAEEMVVSSYGTVLAINDIPKLVVQNLKELEKQGMYDKYGFYEAIDYTPSRVKKGEKRAVVKTYMAHHQGLILLSIDNLVNNNVIQDRFFENPEMEAIDILLQERMPDNVIITKEKKERVEKIKYVDYDYYSERIFDKKSDELNEYNVMSNNDYTIMIDKRGNGYSMYKNNIINRFKHTDTVNEGIHFFLKDINSKKIWSPTNLSIFSRGRDDKIIFYPDRSVYSKIESDIKTSLSVFIAPEEPIEIRRLNIKNISNMKKKIEVSSMLEPVLSPMLQDYAHKAFNNLFLCFEVIDDVIVVKRKSREPGKTDMYMAINLYSGNSSSVDRELEIDKGNLFGRYCMDVPDLIKNSKPFSNKVESTTNPIVAFRESIEIESNEEKNVSLIISVSENKEEAIARIKMYDNVGNIERAVKLSKAQMEAKIQYLGVSGKDVNLYKRILSKIFSRNYNFDYKFSPDKTYNTSELWKFGISGDNKILVVDMNEIAEIDLIKKVVKAYEFFKLLNIDIDVVIINEEPESYENYLQEAINDILWNYDVSRARGMFVLNNLSKEDKDLLMIHADLVLKGKYGNIDYQLDEMDYEYIKKMKNIKFQEKYNVRINPNESNQKQEKNVNTSDLRYYNDFGRI